MSIIIDKKRDHIIKEQAKSIFLGTHRDSALHPKPDEIELDFSWKLSFQLPESPLIRKTRDLFLRFMEQCMDVSFAESGTKEIIFKIDENLEGIENSVINIVQNCIEIVAPHEKGILYAAMRILRIFSNRKAPFIKKGQIENQPSFSNRITSTIFYTSDLKLDDVDNAFPHDYLALMAYFGINGVFWEIDFFDYCNSDILPELKCQNYHNNIKKLNETVERLASYGIGLYFLYSVRVLPEKHPVFIAHPDVMGARVVIGKEENGICLCSSSEKVLSFYEDNFTRLYQNVPGLAGPILLIGGERFTHCYTRPTPPLTNKTNCKVCSNKKPAKAVANMVNRVAAAIRKISPDAEVFCWPYSAFTWSGPEDNYQLELLNNLSEDVCSLANLSTGDFCSGSGAILGDYNIMQPNASTRFKAQLAELRSQGKPIYAKAECSTTPFMFNVPYLPVLYRWGQRAKALHENQVKGVFYHYRYYGFTGSLADELAMESVWGDLDIDEFLKGYCLREYDEFSSGMLNGWQQMSNAWGTIPYSMALSGERQYYVKGPIYLGPAHPFVFDVQNDYGLRRGFTRIRGAVLFPDVADEKREELSSKAYASDLMFTWPIGAEKCEQALLKTCQDWASGAETFSKAFDNPNRKAELDIGICKIIEIHFKTSYNLLRFYRKRDAFLGNGGKNPEIIDKKIEEMQQILKEEIANSLAAIELLKKDPRLGYGYSYGIVYDEEMIQEKIRQCEYVMNVEMPKLGAGLRFHMFGVYP